MRSVTCRRCNTRQNIRLSQNEFQCWQCNFLNSVGPANRQLMGTAAVTAAAAIALAPAASADSATDSAYLREMQRIGFVDVGAHDIFLAQQVCGEMEKVDPHKAFVTAKGANWLVASRRVV